jgi:signal transduction histidine kinase
VDGEVTGAVVTFRDISEEKRREEHMRQAQKMEAIGQLTGGVAHDFNNLLAIIQGNIGYLDGKLEDDSELKALTAPALRATQRGSSLTGQLLAFSRRQPLDVCAVDAGELLRGLDDLLGRSLGEDISVEISVMPDLWHCEVDPGQLEQAIVNLANNARDAMPEGGRLRIEVGNVSLPADTPASHEGVAPGD